MRQSNCGGKDDAGFDVVALEGLFQAIFENSLEAMLFTSPDGRIHRANREACRILNMTEREICEAGRTVIVDETDPRAAVARDERERTGQFRGELFFRRKGGEKFPAEFSSAIFKDRLGERRTVIVFRDVTKQRQAEEERGRLAAIVESSEDAIIGQSLDGRIMSWNTAAERLYGYSQEEIIDRSIQVVVPPERAEELAAAFRQVVRGQRVEIIETQRVTKDHHIIEVALTISPIKNEAGQVIGFSSTARDISAAKRAQEEREHLIQELLAALAEVKMLSGLLPICSSCKKIRDDKGYWNQLESYLRDHAAVTFTHSICPECAKKLYGEIPKTGEAHSDQGT